MKKDKYEISLWEDYLVDAEENVPAHYEERKIAVIGSDTMTSPCRAYNPKLVENINGTNSFTFEMFYTYRENNGAEANVDQQNPFLNLLVNERKVKCKWKDKWYDFIIKNCQEDSSGKKITYTCQDLYINELSKNGFSLTFDNELENNTGTAPELVKKVLKGTDWMLSENNDIIQQEKEEPVYEVKLLQNLIANKDSSPKETGVTIPKDATILIFYNQLQEVITKVNENEGNYPSSIDLQFAYSSVYQTEKNSQLVINADVYSINNLKIEKKTDGNTIYLEFSNDEQIALFKLYFNNGVSEKYRAKKLVKSKISKFDPTTGRYCNILLPKTAGDGYSDKDTIYEYTTTEWNDALVAQNLIVNGSNFIKTDGWTPCGNSTAIPKLGLYYEEKEGTTFGISCLGLSAGVTYLNNSIKHTTSFLPEEGLIKGDRYILRFKIRKTSQKTNGPSSEYITDYSKISAAIKNYTTSEGKIYIGKTTYLKKQNGWIKPKQDEDWVEAEFICTKSLTKKEIYVNQVGLFFTNGDEYTRWIEEIQLFRKIIGSKDDQEVRINPGDFDISSVSKVVYKYYNYTTNSGKTDKDDIEYLHVSTSPWTDNGNLEVQYTDNFDKVRSISAKQSNRFNILQTIAETFECWLQFKILHDENTGKIIYQKGVPQKFVSIKSEIGQETGVGFIYGIDLKTISRTIQSDQIVTKTIVSANDNEFAQSGSCDISRSIENYPRVNYILNFDYYISQGLLDGGQLNNNIYDSTGDICYYYNLNKINKQYQDNSELLVIKNQELLKQQAMQTTYDEAYTASLANVNQLKEELRALAGTSSYNHANTRKYIEENKDVKEVYAKVNALAVEEQKVKNYNKLVNQLTTSINRLSEQIEKKTKEQKALIEKVELLDEKFYKKYFRFIQEGSWTSQDYVDDNLYFLDAQSVAYTSSRPQISYDISVIRISNQEGFENKIFKLGDIAYIQDTEFFGYTYINQVKTPYKEKVLVSSITSYFDEPSKDSFTVQNYKTQFEDSFQRITSTTQSLQYASGKYAKAANIMNDDGTINIETLQSSIAVNENIVYSAQNETFKQDDTGITLTDANNPNDKTKINSKGIFISTDGGTTWKNAVRGEGISTQYLTAGNINVGSIVILDGQFTTFRWDSKGISAYVPIEGGGINLGKFVRFDHYGVYGVNGELNFSPNSEQEIYDKASFGMTWNCFFMKNNKGTGSIEISTDKDIQIKAGENERIKIGRLDENGQQYGIRISDDFGNPVMETGDKGKLWLKNQLNISKSKDDYNIQLGFLDNTKDNSDVHEVFNATNKFIVYEDGSMKATDGEFTGTIHATDGEFTGIIHATGGKIGNMTIGDVEFGIESTKDVEIIANHGTTFQIDANNEVYPSKLDFRMVEKNIIVPSTNNIRWEISSDFEQNSWLLVDQDIEVSIPYETVQFLNNSCYLRLTVIDADGKEYSKFITIHRISDGKHPTILTITSTTGGIYINGEIKAQLRATAWRNGVDITSSYDDQAFVWTKYDRNGTKDLTWNDFGPVIEIDHTEVEQKATFSCELIQE